MVHVPETLKNQIRTKKALLALPDKEDSLDIFSHHFYD